jgi:2-desacetyl-2-hydroxyethyl bacteriochlorophyllide A dehydrogenase
VRRQSLFFTAPFQVEIRDSEFNGPAPGELLVETLLSAISPGTELLIYRGQSPGGLTADENITSLSGDLAFPLQYGYAVVGSVIDTGDDLTRDWIGKTVFSFQPHQTHFTVSPNQVIELPHGIDLRAGVFLPNMETAVNFVMDGRPMIGECVAVFGQGVVGLLTTALLARFPLADLITLDLHPNRRMASLEAGASQSLDPTVSGALERVRGKKGVDLVYELSGSPTVLDQAIEVAGLTGRVVIGSWYGTKRAELDLGGVFHRNRIQLISSQVSTIEPSLTGRWDKSRRFNLAWEMIRQVKPDHWITHMVPFRDAAQGYALLDLHPEGVIQVLLDYTR